MKIFQLPCVAWWTIWALAVTSTLWARLWSQCCVVVCFFGGGFWFQKEDMPGYGWVYDPCDYVMIYCIFKWWFLVDSPWGESSSWRCFDVLAESFERSCGRDRSQWLRAGGQLLGSCTTGGRMSQIIDFEKLDLLLGDSIDPQHGFVAASAYNQQHPSSLLSLLSGDSVHLWSQHVGIHFPGATSEEWTGNIWGSVLKEIRNLKIS